MDGQSEDWVVRLLGSVWDLSAGGSSVNLA